MYTIHIYIYIYIYIGCGAIVKSTASPGAPTGAAVAAGDGEAGGVVREPATVDAAEIRVAHMGDGGDHSRHVDAVGVAASWKAHVAAIGPPEP